MSIPTCTLLYIRITRPRLRDHCASPANSISVTLAWWLEKKEVLPPKCSDSLGAPIAFSGQINSHPTKQQESRSDALASALPLTTKKRNSKLQRIPCRGTRVMIKYYALLCKHLKQKLLLLPTVRTRIFFLSFKHSVILRQNTLEYLTRVFSGLIKRIVMIITVFDMTEVENP